MVETHGVAVTTKRCVNINSGVGWQLEVLSLIVFKVCYSVIAEGMKFNNQYQTLWTAPLLKHGGAVCK